METYHKINAPFFRHLDGPKKGKLIPGKWSTQELEYLAGNQWEFTEKVDGTNIRVHVTYFKSPEQVTVWFGGRTDRAVIPKPLLQSLEETFTNDVLLPWMRDNDLTSVTLFGEGYGPNIQGGGKYRDDHSFVLFDVKIGDTWLTRENVNDVAFKLGISSVPVLGHGTLQDAIDIVSTGLTWDSNGKMTQWGGGGIKGLKSTWGDFEAEGIVARPKVPMFDRRGNRIIVKIKGKDFK